MGRHTEEQVRSEHRIAYEDPTIHSDGRIFCSCGWCSPIAPVDERHGLLIRHVDHEVNAEEWCWGDPDKARQRYFEIESGVRTCTC